jgi:hypothetical protein
MPGFRRASIAPLTRLTVPFTAADTSPHGRGLLPGSLRPGDIADGALDLTGEILRRAAKSILVHEVHSLG